MKMMIPAALAVLIGAAPAAASPCGERIARLEERAGASAATPGAGEAAETAAARLHHQPTPGAVGESGLSADSPEAIRSAKFKVMIEQARAADHAGDATECEASANEAEKALR